MKRVCSKRPRALLLIGGLIHVALAVPGFGAQQDLVEEPVLANVNGEPVVLGDLVRQVNSFHTSMGGEIQPVATPDAGALLDRAIEVRLILQEAQAIGLDELPVIQRRAAIGRMDLLRQKIAEHAVRDIATGDPEIADQIYAEMAREAEIEAVLFQTSEDAEYFQSAIQGGGDFGAQTARQERLGKSIAAQEPQFLKLQEMTPEIAAAVASLEPGEVSMPISTASGYAVVKLLGYRIPEDAEARVQADQQALEMRQQERLREYTQEMRDRYIETDQEVLDSLDFDGSTPEQLEAYKSDSRVVARIKDGEPVTVAELTDRLNQKYFHGMERAAGRKNLNGEIPGILDRLCLDKIAETEANRLGIPDAVDFQAALEQITEGLIFSAFLSKVISPDVSVSEEQARDYYDEHLQEFSSPEMLRIEGIAFTARSDAVAAVDKLRQGADLAWMREHTANQAGPEDSDNLLRFDGSPVVVSTLPRAVRDAVAGASNGDLRFFGDEPGPYYALRINEVLPPRPQPFDDVSNQIQKILFSLEQQRLFDSYAAELRSASEVELLLDAKQLKDLLGLSAGGAS